MVSSTVQAQNLFVTDQSGDIIYEFTNNAGTLSAYATSFASFNNPIGLAFDSASNLFVGSGADNYINEITQGGTQTTFAYAYDPQGLAFDNNGNLFVAVVGSIIEFNNNAGAPGALSTNAVTFASGLNPAGLAFDRAGDLFEADNQSGHVYEFTYNAGKLSSNFVTLASNLPGPYGLAFDSAGDLFVTTAGTNVSAYAALAYLAVPPPVFQSLTIINGFETLVWSTEPGIAYQVQYKNNNNPDLTSSNWYNLGQPETAGGTTITVNVPDFTPDQWRVYRVKASLP